MNLLVKEVITLEVPKLVTLGTMIMEKEKRDLGLEVLVTNVEKEIELLNNNFGKKTGGNSRNTLACKEVDEASNEIENGENLMVRRVLWNEGIDDKLILRRTLFKTRCKIVGKCCNH